MAKKKTVRKSLSQVIEEQQQEIGNLRRALKEMEHDHSYLFGQIQKVTDERDILKQELAAFETELAKREEVSNKLAEQCLTAQSETHALHSRCKELETQLDTAAKIQIEIQEELSNERHLARELQGIIERSLNR